VLCFVAAVTHCSLVTLQSFRAQAVATLRAGCLRLIAASVGHSNNCSITVELTLPQHRTDMVKRSIPLNSPSPVKHQVADADISAGLSQSENVAPQEPIEVVHALPNVGFESPPAAAMISTVDVPTPGSSPASVPRPVSSPGSNRAAFFNQHVPLRITCNMDFCRSSPGSKVGLSAVVIAVFDASANPDRRYIQLADVTGTVGITVWNANVAKFDRSSIGRVIKLGKVVVGNHQGKKVLTMTRESTLEFDDAHPLSVWWQELSHGAPVKLAHVADVADNSIINVAGILGMITSEPKMVGSIPKTLVTLHLADTSGQLDVRSWNHESDSFVTLAEKPIMIKRIRVASFAGKKMGELLDNDGSEIVTQFPGQKVLEQYWVN
jgi:hypothetical protein